MNAPESHESTKELIASGSNNFVKRLRAVRDGRDRDRIFIEGVRLCEEAVNSAGLVLTGALYKPRLLGSERGARLIARIENRMGVRVMPATDEVFASIADTKTSQGILLLAERPHTGAELFETAAKHVPLIVVLHGVGNPANAGAILRAAEAAGATGVITTSAGTCDPFNPKALRGAMGSSFRLPLWTNAEIRDVGAWCAKRDVDLFSLDARAVRTHAEVEWTGAAAIVVGAEGSGFAGGEPAGTLLRIPMKSPVESLNVAVALGIVLYEAARQRAFKF